MIRLRNTHPAFGFDSQMEIKQSGSSITIRWTKEESFAQLDADFTTAHYAITNN